MRLISFVKRLLGNATYDNPNYPKGMNSTIDPLTDLVVIGKGFISAPGSIILAHDASTITHTGKTRIEKTIIGDNVFVGANAVVLAGSNIGDGCIIGAGAIVSKNIPPYSVVAGNPGKVIMKVDDYIKKCESRDVLYDLPKSVQEKHGKGIRYTKVELLEMNKSIYDQYSKRKHKD